MYLSTLTLSLSLLPFIAPTLSAPQPPKPLSEQMATSLLTKNQTNINRHYVSAVLHEGIQKAGVLHSNQRLLTYVSSAISSLVSPNGTLIGWSPTYFSLDDFRVGNNILYYWRTDCRKEHKEKYKKAATSLRRQLDVYPRTPKGGFWHRSPVYKHQMWLDGLYMLQPFYATYTSYFEPENTTAWDDIALQFDLIEEHTRNSTTGLLVHGYDESKKAVWADPVTGASPHVWDRAVGWYFMALVEVLQVYPKELEAYERLRGYLTALAEAVSMAQDGSGGWWLVMDEPFPGMEGNYIESSATAMFTYGYLKGVRTGLLEEMYRDTAVRAWELMVERFVAVEADGSLSWEGTVEVGSLNSDASYEYYISVPLSKNDGKGAGPFMFAATEMEMWKKARV